MTSRQVVLEGGSPWGFRIHGGCDIGLPIKISRVNPGSKAAQKGLREGDIISSINESSTKNLDNSTAHSLLRNAGEQLRLSLNEDGLSSPRRRLKQTIVTTTGTEQKTPSGEIVCRKTEVRKFESGEEKVTEKVKAEVHAEQTKGNPRENVKKMPRKNKKSKTTSESKPKDDHEKHKTLPSCDDIKSETTLEAEKPEKKGLFLSLDKKLKLQVKKQKKKERKREFEAGNKKIPEEMSLIPNVEWECTTELQETEKAFGTLVENVVQIVQVEVMEDENVDLNSPEINSEEEKNLRDFLRTLKIVDHSIAEQGEKSRVEAQFVKNKFHIETIPEDLFEEFIENEEKVQTREAIKAFPRTSPLHSPNTRRREPVMSDSSLAVTHSPTKVFYNYQGVSYPTLPEKLVLEEDIKNGIVAVDTFRNNEPEIYPRRLDVILEESSDFSDASGHSEKKSKAACEIIKGSGLVTVHPVVRETVKIFSLNQKVRDGVDNAADGGSYCVQPVIVEKLKMSDDVVKIELADSESEGDINQSEFSYTAGEVEIVNFEDASSECAKMKSAKDDYSEKSVWSVKSVSSNSSRPAEEGSESWRSSLNDGVEADVESELESQKAFIFGDADDELSFKMSDLLDNNGVEIFITNFEKVDANDSTSERSLKDPCISLNQLPLYEVDDGGPFQNRSFSNPQKHKQIERMDSTSANEEISKTKTDSSDIALSSETTELIRDKVSVKDIAEAIKNDMDKILLTKIKVIRHNKEPLSESYWVSLVNETKDRLGSKNSSSESSLKQLQPSDSSSYENVPKCEKGIPRVSAGSEKRQNPEALSNLAEKKVLTLPYGRLVLKKIGLGSCCSKNSENKDFEEDIYVKTTPASKRDTSMHSPTDHDADENEKSDQNYIEFDYSNPKIGETEKWYGMQTAMPAVLVGLSPSQKKIYEEKQKKWLPDEAEADSLLDLHQKFIERRRYHETNPWNRERNVIYDSSAPAENVSITEISKGNRAFEKLKKSQEESTNDADKMKEKKIAKENVKSLSKFELMPRKTVMRLVGNEKSQNEDGLLKLKCCSVKDYGKKNYDSKAEEKKGETNKQTEKDSEVVGKSRLLAILQNAISDEFVPELNTDSSIICRSENHEVSVVQNQETIKDPWQNKGKFASASKPEEETKMDNSLRRDQKTFQDFWNREKNYCSLQSNGASKARSNYRPKTICCENETELYINEPKFVKEIRAPKKMSFDKTGADEKEELIITENLPAVSDIIKSFEQPKVENLETNIIDYKNKKTRIQIDNEKYQISKKGDIALIQNDDTDRKKLQKEKRKSMPGSILSEKELFKQKMYDEYMSKLAERIERRQQKVIRMSQSNEIECPEETKFLDLENEFISKVKERKEKLKIAEDGTSEKELLESLKKSCQEFRNYWEEEISNLESERTILRENVERLKDGSATESTNSKRSSIQLLDTSSDLENLPKHLKELLQVDGEEFPDFFDGQLFENMPSSVVFSPTFKATAPRPGVWSPAQTVSEDKTEEKEENEERKKLENEPIPPVWTPKSSQASPVLERKEFRPVNFESPTLPRKKYIQDDKKESSVPPPWQQPGGDKPPQLVKSPSSPALSLPKAPNPTVTLLQKAREGHLPRGAHYLNSDMYESPASDGTTVEKLELVSSVINETDRPRTTETGPKKIIGIGPTTKEGIPLVLRSEVTDGNKEKWYKRMYDSLHKYGKDDDYVTVKYRTSPRRRGLYNYQPGSSSGYQSEPESLSYDISSNKYVTLDRRRNEKSKENECINVTLPRSRNSPPRRDFREYKNQPGRIEDYEPGHSSISELEANKWWDEVLEIFDKWLDRNPEARDPACNKLLIDAIQSRSEEEKNRPVIRKSQSPKSFTSYASGYISDPQYVYKRTEDEPQSPPSSEEQKEAYRIIQKGGEIPLKGLRKPAPERPKDSFNTEIEYFPLSPTLTRIRVHKQNITPLRELPFSLYPPYEHTTLNYPTVPFGVCSSFSQVQLFPPPFLPQLSIKEVRSKPSEASDKISQRPESSPGKEHKFSVQLQNISGPNDYVQIVPKPRSHSKKSPIYANIPILERSCSPNPPSVKSEILQPKISETGALISSKQTVGSCKKDSREKSPKREGITTFSDLKRIAPSVNSAAISRISISKIPTKQRKTDNCADKSKELVKKREFLISKLTSKSAVKSKKTDVENKENSIESKKAQKSLTEKNQKKEKKKVPLDKPETKKSVSKVTTAKVPLSESTVREKPLAKTNKRLKTFSENLKKRKTEARNGKLSEEDKSSSIDTKEDIIEYLSRFIEYSNSSYVDLKNPEEIKTVSFRESEEDEERAAMSPIYETVEKKPKIESDMTEVFRSRSFSPDVKRKIFKHPDMNKPVPPKRKESKISPTLKMWSKMMVSYPRHRSRLDAFDSNVKFLGDRIKRKLADDKDTKSEFGDNIETVRTVKKDKNGDMSIKTNRYVRLARPLSSGSLSTRATYPDIERRRLLAEPRTKFGSVDSIRPRKYSDASTISKSVGSDVKKSTKQKLDTVLRSSTTYSVRNPAREEEDKRKSVKVTVAISSKGKELLRKSAGITSPVKKTVSKSSSSPCPSISSFKSGVSGKSDKGSTSSSHGGIDSPQTRLISPNSSVSHLSSPSRSISPGSAITKSKISRAAGTKLGVKKPSGPPIISTYEVKPKPESKKVVAKNKDIGKTVLKTPGKRLLPEGIIRDKHITSSEEKDKIKKLKRNGNGKIRTIIHKKSPEKEDEVIRGRDLVRTDSFFQNLFLRGPIRKSPVGELERMSSVLERARRYQTQINWPETYKSEPSLSLVTYYLNQKRPVSFSKFRNWDRELSSPRSHSPLGSFHSETFQKKLRRFDSVSQFGDGLQRDLSPEVKERSSSEPPLLRSHADSPEQKLERKSSRISLSEASSIRSSPNSSRSPSCRRIHSYKSSLRTSEGGRDAKKFRVRSAGEVEDMKSKSNLQYGDLGKSSSSLNLSNLSDHAEYQAYILELMHSTRKCERFRELHKFYSNLERMGKLEKTASTGDLRPRLRNEEIIDFDRWKKIRTKERAEAELKTLVDDLVKVQKEKDLLFRAADIEVVRWKGDSGLRIKERSVEDLKEQFNRYSEKNLDSDTWKKAIELRKDHYKPLWRGSSIVDVASNLNNTLVSHRGRPITLQELEKIEKSKARIGKEYGYSLKAWSSLSNEQVNALKDQLSEIYMQDAKRRYIDGSLESLPDKFEILVPKDRDIQSPGEGSLQVRCSSALSKSQTYTPTIRRKEEIQKEWKKADSIGALPTTDENVSLPQLPWKDDTRIVRSHSEGRTPKHDRYPVLRSKSASSSKPLSENEKKRLSLTLSKEVIEKMTKAGGKGPLFPRETLGALAAAGSKLREYGSIQEKKKGVEKLIDEKMNGEDDIVESETGKEESRSGSSETSVKTVIRKNSMDVLKKVQYFEELQQSPDEFINRDELREDLLENQDKVKVKETKKENKLSKKKDKKRNILVSSSSMENLNDYFGQQKQYATSPVQKKPAAKFGDTSKSLVPIPSRSEDFYDLRNIFDDKKSLPMRYYSTSPLGLCSGSSNESLFSYRSRSVSPDPTKYYRAYLRMVKCGAVRKLCNKFESWEDLLSLSSDRDFWLPPPPRRFASDPELTRDLLKRFGTDPTKVTIRGQEVGDVRWLRTKFEKGLHPRRGRSRFRRIRSPLMRSPLTFADRFMPRINVISKTAELQMQGLGSDRKQKDVSSSKAHLLAASPEGYRSLIDYTKDHGGYYYTGEVEKLRRKFERLQEAERLSILGQMYTSTPDVNELRDIAPYLECSWIAHRYPEVTKTVSTPEPQTRRQEPPKKPQLKPRPHSSSPIRPKQPSSILKPSGPHPDRNVFADQKFDPSIHRPKYRYQPEREVDRRYKRGDPDWWRHWNKPTVTFKESVSFKTEPEIRDLSPESPRKYVESEVTIHYKSPVRSETKAVLSEDELARRQAESMKRIYKEERRRKYLQELQDMNSRRHTDNFIPSQKSPISLNRYDDFPADSSAYYRKDYATDPVLVARGLYDFVGRRPRELGFRRGDIIFIIRKLDKNWCEGELNGVVGLFPLSYVEVIPYNEINLKYGRARAKYNFIPQTSLELLAHKGDMIVLLRKIDENWFEGRIGERTGIIPASYCHVLAMPQASRIPLRMEKTVSKPVAAPAAHSLIHNGSGLSSKHYYTPYLSPSSPGRSTTSSASVNYHDSHPSADMLIDEALMQLDEEFDLKRSTSKSTSQPLNVRINPRPEPELYQVLFNHVPNNDDELELIQGETVTVIEKCGDGWYIGSKTDGKLGIFPGTHVRRIAPEFV